MSETPHVLVITQGDDDDVDYAISCPGTRAGDCQMFRTCTVDVEHDDDALWETSEAHGVEHQHIDGEWMVPDNPSRCWVRETASWDWDSYAGELDLPPGEHEVLAWGQTPDEFQLYLPGTKPRPW